MYFSSKGHKAKVTPAHGAEGQHWYKGLKEVSHNFSDGPWVCGLKNVIVVYFHKYFKDQFKKKAVNNYYCEEYLMKVK